MVKAMVREESWSEVKLEAHRLFSHFNVRKMSSRSKPLFANSILLPLALPPKRTITTF